MPFNLRSMYVQFMPDTHKLAYMENISSNTQSITMFL